MNQSQEESPLVEEKAGCLREWEGAQIPPKALVLPRRPDRTDRWTRHDHTAMDRDRDSGRVVRASHMMGAAGGLSNGEWGGRVARCRVSVAHNARGLGGSERKPFAAEGGQRRVDVCSVRGLGTVHNQPSSLSSSSSRGAAHSLAYPRMRTDIRCQNGPRFATEDTQPPLPHKPCASGLQRGWGGEPEVPMSAPPLAHQHVM
jgi:hypothetical protein